jgi:hypothetical protein
VGAKNTPYPGKWVRNVSSRIERQPETEEEIAAVIEAACGSCVEAIRYCGTDAMILAKLKELGYERLCDALVRGIAEPGAAPNGGPATPLGNSGVSEGPPIGELNR